MPVSHAGFAGLLRVLFPCGVRKTLKNILAEYGGVALVLYLAIFFVVLGGFWFAIRMGFRPAGTGGKVGTFAAAYIATKLTQPLRIGLTIVLTPLLARAWKRIRGPRPAQAEVAPPDVETQRADR